MKGSTCSELNMLRVHHVQGSSCLRGPHVKGVLTSEGSSCPHVLMFKVLKFKGCSCFRFPYVSGFIMFQGALL